VSVIFQVCRRKDCHWQSAGEERDRRGVEAARGGTHQLLLIVSPSTTSPDSHHPIYPSSMSSDTPCGRRSTSYTWTLGES
jgi:hypothetical protein